MDTLIEVEGLWKKYSGNLKKSFRHAHHQLIRGVLGLPPSPGTLRSSEFWALTDVSFSLRRGEVLAVLGHNGAGKSTLLKCLTGNLRADRGSVRTQGKIGHILEMSAGFSPLMTGRDNVVIRGRLMGKTGRALGDYVSAVEEFADIGDFFDSPVQFYSSGMKSRLGFAASSSIDPDVLVLDEVLAVGDLGFRMKCYARIDELRRKCAVILVSHSMNQVSRMASKAIYLKKGTVCFQGTPQQAIDLYQQDNGWSGQKSPGFNPELVQFSVRCEDSLLPEFGAIDFGTHLRVEGKLEINAPLTLSVILHQAGAGAIVEWNSKRSGLQPRSCNQFAVDLGPQYLCPGNYHLSLLGFGESGEQIFLSHPFQFKVAGDYLNSISLQPVAKWNFQSDNGAA
jgi:lipopolysaccharide transport system ATP-binding protein